MRVPDSLYPLEDFSGKINRMGISRTRRELAHKEKEKVTISNALASCSDQIFFFELASPFRLRDRNVVSVRSREYLRRPKALSRPSRIILNGPLLLEVDRTSVLNLREFEFPARSLLHAPEGKSEWK